MDGLFHTRTSDSKRNSMHNTIMVMEDMISSSGSGARSVADGATVHLRLESLKSDAALKLLQQTTWKTFFTTSPTTSGKGDAKLFSINENSPTRSAFSASTTWPAPSNAFSVADFFPRPSTGTASGRSLASIAASRPMSPEILKGLSSSGPIDVAAALSHGNDSISAAFSEMVERVEDLWVDLKIPQADRNFYRESLCRGPPSSVQHCQEISRYILMLKAHRSATLAVVRAIEIREYALSKCMDLLYAMNRKSSRLTSSLYISAARGGRDTIRDLATANNSSSNTIIDGLSLDDFKSRSAASSPSDVTASLFRDELVATLRDIQLSSVDVIRLIQLWRRNLWRPYPFMHRREGYRECNYLIKMTTDMDLLRTDFYMNVLKGIPLDPRELLCVLFSKEESGDANRNNQNDSSSNNDDNINDTSNSPSNQNCDNDASNTADNSNIQSPAPEVKEIIDTNVPAVQSVEEGVTEGHSYISDFEGSGTVAIAVSGTCSPETKLELEIMTTCVEDAIEDSEKEEVRGVRASNSFRSMDSSVQSDVENYFRDSYFADRIYTDLKNASAVVQEEDRLQAALDTEKIDLKRRKVFIPLLKLRPAKRD